MFSPTVFALFYDSDDDFEFPPTELPDFDPPDEDSSEEDIPEGGITTITEHPHHVSVRTFNVHVCAGSLITPTTALTSARPIEEFNPSEYSVLAGSSVHSGDSNAQIRRLKRILRHPEYNELFNFNNIALLYWERPMQLGATVRAIALPQQFSPVPYGRNGTITGWGLLNNSPARRLKAATVPLLSDSKCNSILDAPLTSDMLCAREAPGGIGSGEGDFGAALVVNGVQIGISSWGYGYDGPGYPGVYTKVANFSFWIRDNL